MAIAIYIDAGRDRNGNPKRGWIIADDDGSFKDFIDEGFQGTGALKNGPYANVPSTQRLEVAASVYRDAVKQSYGSLPSIHSQTTRSRRR